MNFLRLKWVAAAFILSLGSFAFAETLDGGPFVITEAGIQNGGTLGYFRTENPKCPIFYVPNADKSAENFMKLVFSARIARQPLARIDFSRNGDGSCTVELLQL